MWPQFKFAINPALSVVVVLLWIRISTTIYQITSSLVKRHPILWYQMGCPKVPRYFIGIDVVIMFSFVRPRLTRWIVSGEFKRLRDHELIRLVQRLKGLIGILVATFVSVLLFAVLRESQGN